MEGAEVLEKKAKYQTLSMDIDTNTAAVQTKNFSLDQGFKNVDGVFALLLSGEDTFSVQVKDQANTYIEDVHALLVQPDKAIPQNQRFLNTFIPTKGTVLTVEVKWLGSLTAGTKKFQLVCRLKK